MLRSAWIIFASIVVTFILSVTAIISGLISPYSNATNNVVRFWARSLLNIAGIDVKISGLEKIDPTQPYVFMSNHQSTFDIMTCLAILPGSARFLAKKELFRIPIFAQGMKAVGMIPIDRSNSKKARSSLDKAVQDIKNGVSVIIFPEGTRTRDGNIQPFKKGGFILAIQGQIPIAPMVLSGAMQVMQKKKLYLQKGSINIEFLDPVDTSKFRYENRNELIDGIRDKIVARYKEINN